VPTQGEEDYRLLSTTALTEIEFVRRRITDTLGSGTTTDASLDDWEHSILSYGEASRWADSRALLASLVADFVDLERQLSSRQPTRNQRRLCRLAAQLAGLTSLVLTKAGVHGAARNWARTARLAATEAGDSTTRAWVEAQEAYALFYGGGSPAAAIEVARLAQTIGRGPSVGGALAAALEGRAYGVLGNLSSSLRAIERADDILSRLGSDARASSAFGYNEAQLRFHEGNALTHLGEIEPAWEAQKRALALYPVEDSDRILVHLDRAIGLAVSGEAEAAIAHALDTLADAPAEHRVGIVAVRTKQLVDQLRQQKLSASLLGGDVRHLLELTNRTDD
jgi:tetratricopeptide (TPR) repeat protein